MSSLVGGHETATGYPSWVPDSSPEDTTNHEQSRGTELRLLVEEFALKRGDAISQDGPALDNGELIRRGLEIMANNHNLLEDCGAAKDYGLEEPACSVCVPIAINSEESGRISRTVQLIHAAQQNLGRPVQVILWANARYNYMEEKCVVTAAAIDNYRNMRELIAPHIGEGFHIRSALQVLPDAEATMSKLRANYMDAVAIEALRRGYKPDHPVLWLDADTTFISKRCLYEMLTAVHELDAFMIHADTRFSVDWTVELPFQQLDDATKAVMINEIHRRQHSRIHQKGGSLRARGYPEEWGLAFAIGTYLWAGGLRTNRALGEAPGLRKNIEAAYMTTGRHELPRFIFTRIDGKDRPIRTLEYINHAKVSSSARRFHENARVYGIEGLEYPATPAGEYLLFADLASRSSSAQSSQQITREEIIRLVDEGDAYMSQLCHSDPNWRSDREALNRAIISKLIERCFNE